LIVPPIEYNFPSAPRQESAVKNDLISVSRGLLQGLDELGLLSIDLSSDMPARDDRKLAISIILTFKGRYLVMHLPEECFEDPEHFVKSDRIRQYLAHKIGKRLLILRVNGGAVSFHVYLKEMDAFQVPPGAVRARALIPVRVLDWAPSLASA
jgi:hypothetical protein